MQQVTFKVVGNEWVYRKSNDNRWEPEEATEAFVKRISATPSDIYAITDCETTGLIWGRDKLFSLALKINGEIYYFNFKAYEGEPEVIPDFVLKSPERFRDIFESPRRWVGHNLKFDGHMYREFGYELCGELYCTMINERLLSNDEFRYSLAECVKRNVPGFAKDDAVEDYIEKYGLFHLEKVKGKKRELKMKYYHLVPFSIMAPYACMDVEVTDKLYQSQLARQPVVQSLSILHGPKLLKLIAMENSLLQVCLEIERHGVKVDREFCKKGLLYEETKVKEVEEWFEREFKEEFIDSAKFLAPIFERLGHPIGKTAAGNDSISEAILSGINGELARKVLAHREAFKRQDTYFQAFLNLSRESGTLHPDMKQTGTRTGRFSYSDPNLQNIPAEDESPYPIRRALVPREGHFFFMPDYNQMEFRMMLDYAGEMELIQKIIEGHDPHQATADLTKLTRKAAKTLNFGLLYGMGIQKLANALGITYEEAKAFKWQYFGALPKVKDLIYQTTAVAKSRKRVYTWAGRKLDFPNEDFCYKAINGIIQGGCADVVKIAMVKLFEELKTYGTRIIMQVHDELLFEMPYDEVHLIGTIKQAMESIFPNRFLPLTVGLSYSLNSFHDSIEAKTPSEIEAAIREHVSKAGNEISGGLTKHLVQEDKPAFH